MSNQASGKSRQNIEKHNSISSMRSQIVDRTIAHQKPTSVVKGSRRNICDRNVVLSVGSQNLTSDQQAVDVRRSQRTHSKKKPMQEYNVNKVKCPVCKRIFGKIFGMRAASMNFFDDFFVCSIECWKKFL